MSAIQEPTPEMGPYTTAIRRESFYLHVHGLLPGLEVEWINPHTVRVPAAHAAHLLATLDQITATNAWKEWTAAAPGDGTGRDAIVVARDPGGDQLCIRFPGRVYFEYRDSDDGPAALIGTEVAYWEVEAFRDQLTADPADLPQWSPPAEGEQPAPFPGTWQVIACTDRPAVLLIATFRDGEVPLARESRHVLRIPLGHVPSILTAFDASARAGLFWPGEPRLDGVEVTRDRDALLVDFPGPVTYDSTDEPGEDREDTFLVQVDAWDVTALRARLTSELSR